MADDHNIKPRLIYCPKCQKEETDDRINPQCSDCKVAMIVAVKSQLDGDYFHRRLQIPPIFLPGVKT